MRVAVASFSGCPNYCIDGLADGLIRILGRTEVYLHYPPGFLGRYSNPRWSFLYSQFSNHNAFNLYDADILFTDLRGSNEVVTDWVRHTGNDKIVVVDSEDHSNINNSMIGRKLYLKRECIKGITYPVNVKPFPMAAIPETIVNMTRTFDSFFAGTITHNDRFAANKYLTEVGVCLKTGLSKYDYNNMMEQVWLGIDIRGSGYGTYRYFEIPYFGAVLVAKRSPLVIPNDFTDNECIRFDDWPQFPDTVRSILNDRHKLEAVRLAGAAACHARHLTINRAQYAMELVMCV